MVDACIEKYLGIIRNQNKNSAETVSYYLKDFEVFCATGLDAVDKKGPVCEVITKLRSGKWNDGPKEEQPYDVLGRYASWLNTERLETGDNNARTVAYKISWARKLLEVNFIVISKTLFKALVKSPKQEEPDTSPVEKKIVASILLALSEIRMRSYVMFLASGGWRATESLTLTLGNLENFEINSLKFTGTPFIATSGKHAKTKKGKRRQLTNETARQIEKLLAFNYRNRRVHHKLPDGKYVNRKVTLAPKLTDPIFAPYHSEVSEYYKMAKTGRISREDALDNLYSATSKKFRQATDRLGIKFEDNGNGNRRTVTLHTLRRFVYTQCKRVVDEGYAKYHIGRKTHEYDKSTPEQIAEDFAKVEPYLTLLDVSGLEARSADVDSRIEGLQERNEELAERVRRLEAEKRELEQEDEERQDEKEIQQEWAYFFAKNRDLPMDQLMQKWAVHVTKRSEWHVS